MKKIVLVLGLVVCVDETMTVEKLGNDVWLDRHVEGGAGFLTLKQVRVVANLHTNMQLEVILSKNTSCGYMILWVTRKICRKKTPLCTVK